MYVQKVIFGLNKDEAKLEGPKQFQETYDKIFIPNPQEGKAKRSQSGLFDVPKDVFNVSWHQEQIIKECCHASPL